MDKTILNIIKDTKLGCSISEILRNNNITLNRFILIKSIFIDNLDQKFLR